MELGRVYKITMPAHNEWTEETHEKKKVKRLPYTNKHPLPPSPFTIIKRIQTNPTK